MDNLSRNASVFTTEKDCIHVFGEGVCFAELEDGGVGNFPSEACSTF